MFHVLTFSNDPWACCRWVWSQMQGKGGTRRNMAFRGKFLVLRGSQGQSRDSPDSNLTNFFYLNRTFLQGKCTGLVCSSVAQHLSNRHQALGSIPSTTETNKTKHKVCTCSVGDTIFFLNLFDLWLVESMDVEPMDTEGWLHKNSKNVHCSHQLLYSTQFFS